MKTHVIIATTLVFSAIMDSTMGMPQFLQELPNGSLFKQDLGHPGNDSSKETPFAQAFDNAGQSWSKSLCEAKFPRSSMTNGQAFGDPCCTWNKGGKPDFTVAPFTTTPGKATTCASNGAPSPASGPSNGPLGGASDATKDWAPVPASDATKGNTGESASPPSSRCQGKMRSRQ
ncbi:uncharacterized protein PITG_23207 [Phytophthora infestans T30-4]|uniref:Temptin Cys/Cys disulfide domain-containing protein n=1 Tax=Phytophthora infestans (strain T30-4) TaxID=403677 RepID=D0P427_PHYIT|nr:uncharacterized protein PITG_23207 [Phytophthora infestans T30-4]EEY62757.1 hypothetical protein PITG_23207 [Phytophthora infestans T30-4]|eukprot:XP_002894946.1 hypothetical protein PITG_23207 [Phytophthora infestans T30-4]